MQSSDHCVLVCALKERGAIKPICENLNSLTGQLNLNIIGRSALWPYVHRRVSDWTNGQNKDVGCRLPGTEPSIVSWGKRQGTKVILCDDWFSPAEHFGWSGRRLRDSEMMHWHSSFGELRRSRSATWPASRSSAYIGLISVWVTQTASMAWSVIAVQCVSEEQRATTPNLIKRTSVTWEQYCAMAHNLATALDGY
jgi:hypothetical protein